MGNCIGKNNEKQQFCIDNLIPGRFKSAYSITDLKIKNLSLIACKMGVFVRIKMEEQLLTQTSAKHDLVPRWNPKVTKLVEATETELVKMKFSIQILNRKKQLLTQKAFSLYSVLKRPFHHDLQVRILDSDSRVSFDLKAYQFMSIDVTLKNVKVELQKEILQLSYLYSLAVYQDPNLFRSQNSRTIKFQNVKAKAQRLYIQWPETGPTLSFQTNSKQLESTIVHFTLLSQHDFSEGNQIICEACIGLLKLLEQDFQDDKTKLNKTYRIKDTTFKMYSHGTVFGSVQLDFELKVPYHHCQPVFGVVTEKGVQSSTPIFTRTSKTSVEQVQKLKQLSQKLSDLEASLFSQNDRKVALKKAQQIFVKLNGLLQKSNKQSLITYLYDSPKELLEAQQVFIELGKLIHKIEDEDNVGVLKKPCQELLVLLIRRGELNLQHMKFGHQLMEEKVIISVQFQKFVYAMLAECIRKICKKDLFNEQRKFIQNFLAYCYFLVPKFRLQFLQCVDRQNDVQITEWRGTQFDLKPSPRDLVDFGFREHFDWHQNFYRFINKEAHDSNDDYLDQVLKNSDWKKRIHKRGTAFFQFMIEWIDLVKRVLVINQRGLKWHQIPGYKVLLRGLLSELKLRQVSRYSNSLKNAAVLWTTNQRILNVLVMIIFQKTSVFDVSDTRQTLQLVSNIFKNVKNKRLPSSFSFDFFFTGLKIVTEGTHCYNAALALKIIYDHFNLFELRWQLQIISYFVGPISLYLFSHWSIHVRKFYLHLLTYCVFPKIFRCDQISVSKQVSELMLRLREQYQRRLDRIQEQASSSSPINFSQMEPKYYKAMRIKLKEKKRKLKLLQEKNSFKELKMINARKNIQLKAGSTAALTFDRSVSSVDRSQRKIQPALSPCKIDWISQQFTLSSQSKAYLLQGINQFESLNEQLRQAEGRGKGLAKPELQVEVRGNQDQLPLVQEY